MTDYAKGIANSTDPTSHMGLYTMRLLQTDRYKYVFHLNDIDELYHHASDPHERDNVAQDSRYAADLKALKRRMVEWMARTKDHLYNEWIVCWLTGDLQLAAQSPSRARTPWEVCRNESSQFTQ